MFYSESWLKVILFKCQKKTDLFYSNEIELFFCVKL